MLLLPSQSLLVATSALPRPPDTSPLRPPLAASSVLPRPPLYSRLDFLLASTAVALAPSAASAKYGQFAKMDGSQNGAAGDSDNECLFAMPGTGVCTVFKSSEPTLYASPDVTAATNKLEKATVQLNQLGDLLQQSKWTAIAQVLGASRDLREAVGFLTLDKAFATAAAKKVFKDLEGIQLAAQKKDRDTGLTFFKRYVEDIPALLRSL